MKNIKKYNDFKLFESVKSQEKFYKDVEKLVKKYGGVLIKNDEYRINLEIITAYGKYVISLHKSVIDSIYSIYGRFDDVNVLNDPIISQFRPNTWSGKCNFHNKSSKEIILDFEYFLSIITTPNIYTNAKKYNVL